MDLTTKDFTMTSLIKQFKKLKTPQRVSLMSDFLLIHTDILKLSKKPATNEKPNEKITNYFTKK